METNITLYYIGGDGRENRPHRILYGQNKMVMTPPVGEAFARKFTRREVTEIMAATAHSTPKDIFYPVTESKAVADARKKGRPIQDILQNLDKAILSTNDLFAEIEKRPELKDQLKKMLLDEEPTAEEPKKSTRKKASAEVTTNA